MRRNRGTYQQVPKSFSGFRNNLLDLTGGHANNVGMTRSSNNSIDIPGGDSMNSSFLPIAALPSPGTDPTGATIASPTRRPFPCTWLSRWRDHLPERRPGSNLTTVRNILPGRYFALSARRPRLPFHAGGGFLYSTPATPEKDRKMEPMTIEEACAEIRAELEAKKLDVSRILNFDEFKGETCPLAEGNVPNSRNANMAANITLAFRHLEDARMRLGKVMQAYQGGVSKFDRSGPDSAA